MSGDSTGRERASGARATSGPASVTGAAPAPSAGDAPDGGHANNAETGAPSASEGGDATSSARDKTGPLRTIELRVALIGAIAAVVGALVGGAISYAGNKAMLDHQASERREQEAASTRGAARRLNYQLVVAAADVQGTIKSRRVPPRTRLRTVGELSTAEQNLLYGRLTPPNWLRVTTAQVALRDYLALLSEAPERTLSSTDVDVLLKIRDTLAYGAQAMTSVSGLKDFGLPEPSNEKALERWLLPRPLPQHP
jgi:hypothetical protein